MIKVKKSFRSHLQNPLSLANSYVTKSMVSGYCRRKDLVARPMYINLYHFIVLILIMHVL